MRATPARECSRFDPRRSLPDLPPAVSRGSDVDRPRHATAVPMKGRLLRAMRARLAIPAAVVAAG